MQTRGCLSCHTLDLANEYKARDLAELPASAWASSWHDPSSTSARYSLTADERAAFRAFAATDRRSLERHAPADFAASAVETLNCRGCHGQIERVPSLDLVGGKLRPEWAKALIDGTLRVQTSPVDGSEDAGISDLRGTAGGGTRRPARVGCDVTARLVAD